MDTTDMIRDIRTAAGYTQAQLARRAGTTQSMIARYESGAVSPTIGALARIVRACGQELIFATADYPQRAYTAPDVEPPAQAPRSTVRAGISDYLNRPDSGWRPAAGSKAPPAPPR
jgi:transcriptional regulator with XRE-family HTH domain